jgi:hypothetical protein
VVAANTLIRGHDSVLCTHTQHRDLVPQDEQLDFFGAGSAAHQQEQPEQVLEDQVEQP